METIKKILDAALETGKLIVSGTSECLLAQSKVDEIIKMLGESEYVKTYEQPI